MNERNEPAVAFESVRNLADRNGVAIRIGNGDIGQILGGIAAQALEIDVGDGGLGLGHVGHLLGDEVLRLVDQIRHWWQRDCREQQEDEEVQSEKKNLGEFENGEMDG